jgi:hypothetical protein
VLRVEMRDAVFIVVHEDDDAAEGGDPWHATSLSTMNRMLPFR